MLVILTESAQAQFDAIADEKLSTRIRDVFARLEKWPEVSGVKHLHYNWEGFARIRNGKWRVIFTVERGRYSGEDREEGRRYIQEEVIWWMFQLSLWTR